jgi:hypothetical protein
MAPGQWSYDVLISSGLLAQCLIALSARGLIARSARGLIARSARADRAFEARSWARLPSLLLRATAGDSRCSQLNHSNQRTSVSSKYSAMGDELGINSRDFHHIAKNTRRTCRDQLAPRYGSVIVSDSVHRLKSKRGPPSRRSATCAAAEAGLGEPVVVRGDLECPARRRSARLRVAR